MKKLILTIIVLSGFLANLNAQTQYKTTDGFFGETRSIYRNGNQNDLMPLLPNTYNSLNDFDATGATPDTPAPLGSGLLILTGLAIAYSKRKKEESIKKTYQCFSILKITLIRLNLLCVFTSLRLKNLKPYSAVSLSHSISSMPRLA